MHALFDAPRAHPEIAIFLALGLGLWFAGTRIGRDLGTVASTLIVGLVIGQLGFNLVSVVSNTFFTMFLFAVGYSVGPRFVSALKTDGVPQIAFTLIVCAAGFGAAYAAGKLLGYGPALTAGLLGGGVTNSGTHGVATANLGQLGLDAQYVFKFPPVVLLRARAGAHTTTTAFGSLQEATENTTTLGYTIPYAAGRLVLAVTGVAISRVVK